MKFCSSIILLSMLVASAMAWGGYKIKLEYSDLEYDENLMSVDVQMKKRDDKTVINIKSELFEDVEEQLIVHVSHYEKDKKEYQHLLNTSVNVCNIMSRIKTHPILRIVLKELMKTSNFPTACPIKKGLYYMKDFALNEELLPPFLPEGSFMSKSRITRVINGEEVPLLKITVYVDIAYGKDRQKFVR